MRLSSKGSFVTAVLLLISGFTPARAQLLQQAKLVGSGSVPSTGASAGVKEGQSVAISSDGSTAIIGGSQDSNLTGAAWIFTRSSGIWNQQGGKLVGSGTVAGSNTLQGTAVSISADGNTAIVGGPSDNFSVGAAWIFTRSGSSWSQQGGKLVASDFAGSGGDFAGVRQGAAVALSADGNTALIGGPGDNSGRGAAWIFTRSGGTWTQAGSKLVPSDGATPGFGSAVALSSDGSTAIIGGRNDSQAVGATWAFVKSGGTWVQQGGKLVGTGSAGLALQGSAVAVSTDGNTAVVGGPGDNTSNGAIWVFTRSGSTWTQVGAKLTATGQSGAAEVGSSIALSGNGVTAIAGGPQDNGGVGALWVFTQSGGLWGQRGSKIVGSGALGTVMTLGVSAAVSSDGTTAIAGGPADGSDVGNFIATGAAWVFTQPTGPHFGVSAPTSANVGTPFNITVSALDANSNLTPGYSGTVHFTSTDPAAVLPADSTLTNGTGNFSVTLRTAGNQSITATDTANASLTGTSGAIAAAVGTSPVSTTPAVGSGSGSQVFTFVFTDPRGWQDLDVVNVLINNFLDGRNACYLAYSRSAGVLYLVADNGGTLLGLPLNGSSSVSNSQCTVNGVGSNAAGGGNNLTLNVNLSFSSSTFAGNKITYMAARDLQGGNSGWQALGVWNVPGQNTFPSVVSVNPSSGSGLNKIFTFTFSDTHGYQDLGVENILINNFLDGRQACYLAYSRPFSVLYLVNDTGTALSTGLTLGGAGSISNSQCTVNAAGSSATGSGNNLTLVLNMSFTTAFDGNRVIYMAARDSTDANNSGWQSMGTWTVQ
jgi:hypothetical protein